MTPIPESDPKGRRPGNHAPESRLVPGKDHCVRQALNETNFMNTRNRGFLAPTVSGRNDFNKVLLHIDCIPGNEDILPGCKLHQDRLVSGGMPRCLNKKNTRK